MRARRIETLNPTCKRINFPTAFMAGNHSNVNKHYIPKVAAILAAILLVPFADIARAQPALERIGIYDSRAIAVAYAGSAGQVKKMKELSARMKKAKETGDTNEVSRLDAEGRAWQAALERQGFGTAPVDDLLAEIAGELPAIRKAADVSRLISKWDKAELNRHPHAERIDVTSQLVDAFQPNAIQRQRALEIQKTKPVRTIK